MQRTRAETVAKFYPKFIERFPTWYSLSASSTEEIGHFLKPIGLWRRRAESIKRLADEMYAKGGRFPRERKDIEQLPGIGQYIANSVLLFCFGIPQPLLDENMARVLERYFGPRKLADIRFDPYLQALAAAIVNCEKPRELNWAILDLAAKVCKIRSPHCLKCPVAGNCDYPTR
ncbi:MAG: hypothetical protein IIA59_06920 [Candidatus Marinimicrobia bacterium]|nr:hypothetical protein [Candidatus Neomarinimicrobiota bacterium]